MKTGRPVYWEDLTWSEVPAVLAASNASVLWPFGATEQHGPHLGLGTDTLIARAVCDKVSARTGVPVLPAMPVGCSLGHSRKWPGTLSLRPTTLISMVVEIGGWLHACGVRRLFMVNSHVTNFAPLRCALEELRYAHADLMVAVINTAETSERTRQMFFREGPDWHANAAETSLILAIRPDAVRANLAAASDDPDRTGGLQFAHPVNRTSSNGVTGSPSLATETEGRDLLEQMVADLADRIKAGLNEQPPLH